MKIGIISDLHLGFRQYGSLEREEDFYNHFLLVCEEINKVGVDVVIIAGDLFDKATPSPKAISYYRKGVLSLDSDMIVTIKGNHTMLMRDNHYSIDEFFSEDEIIGYYLLDDSCITTYEHGFSSNTKDSKYTTGQNVWIDGITYRSNSNIEEFLDVQHNLAERKNDNKGYRILVVHQSFKEFCGFTGEQLSINDIDYSNYDAIICGHIHSRMDIQLEDGTWFIQPGSIERMNTTEAFDEIQNNKGFYVLNTSSNELNFYPVFCSRKFLIGDINIESEKDIETHFDELEEILNKIDYPPIISYDYHVFGGNINHIREYVGQVKNSILLNKSNIYDEVQKELFVEISDEEIPTIQSAIKSAMEDMTENEKGLAIDIYENLSKGKDITGLLDSFYKKNFKKEIEFEDAVSNDDELLKIIDYFTDSEV